jgi:hypothetical protein
VLELLDSAGGKSKMPAIPHHVIAGGGGDYASDVASVGATMALLVMVARG